jgi:hypothetical protein
MLEHNVKELAATMNALCRRCPVLLLSALIFNLQVVRRAMQIEPIITCQTGISAAEHGGIHGSYGRNAPEPRISKLLQLSSYVQF